MIDMMSLEVGTRFFVHNGGWTGEIIIKDNIKYVRVALFQNYTAHPQKGFHEVEITEENRYTDNFIEIVETRKQRIISLKSKLAELREKEQEILAELDNLK